jgi:ABC-type uncharacterized transport system substrate-binding protein
VSPNSKIKVLILLSLAFIGLHFPTHADAADKKRIAVVHSYFTDFDWTNEIDLAIKSVFKGETPPDTKIAAKKMNVEFLTEFLNSKNFNKPSEIQEKSAEILKHIREFKPDIVLVSDDNALEYIGRPLAKDLPVVFCGINSDPVKSGVASSAGVLKNKATGILERYAFKSIIQLAHRLVPGRRSLYILRDDSETGRAIEAELQGKRKSENLDQAIRSAGFQLKETFASNSWKEWQTFIKTIDPKNSVVFFLAFYTLKDERGRTLAIREVADWIAANSIVPNFGTATWHVANGFLATVGVSGRRQGTVAAQIAQKILLGEDPSSIPVTTPNEYRLFISPARAKQIGLTIPLDLLTYAKTTPQLFRENNHAD